MDVNEGVASEMFTKRLQKSKLKELERDLHEAKPKDQFKIKSQMDALKKAVFVDERRVEQRKAGFEFAKKNVRKEAMSEFM